MQKEVDYFKRNSYDAQNTRLAKQTGFYSSFKYCKKMAPKQFSRSAEKSHFPQI